MTELDEARERLTGIASWLSTGEPDYSLSSRSAASIAADLRTLLTAWNTRPDAGEPVAWRARYGSGPWNLTADDRLEHWRHNGWEVQPLYTRPSVDREGVARIIREHVKVDATGLAPAVVGHCIFGFEEAADAILSLMGGGGVPAGWQPTETAPENGRFLVYARVEGECREWRVVAVDRRDGGAFGVDGGEYGFWSVERATHWMPLPAAPASTVEG